MAVELHKKYLLGEFELDVDRRLLSRSGDAVRLAHKPFQVLLYLVERRERLVTRRELLDLFWDGRNVYDVTLTKCVSTIRKALDDQQERPRFIETRWAEGYRYIGPLQESPAPLDIEPGSLPELAKTLVTAPAQSEAESLAGQTGRVASGERVTAKPAHTTDGPGPPPKAERRGRLAALIAAGLVAVLAAWVYILFRPRAPQAPEPPAPIRSIAVLPLRNLSDDPANDYFSDGMTDSLISALLKVEGLKVISRGSVFRYKGREIDPREVGRQLDVATVLEGSVRKDANSVRVSVRLVSTDDGHALWASKTYEHALQDVFALQDEIARNVATELKAQLSGRREEPLVRRYTEDVEAYQLYLKGRYHLNKRTEEGFKKGIEYFEQAIEHDPRYALAHAGLADAYILLGAGDYAVLAPREAMRKAKVAATTALELDETLAEAHTSLGFLHYIYDWDWPSAERHYRRAVELNTNYAPAHHWYALYLSAMNRMSEAAEQGERARDLDPVSLIVNTDLGLIYYRARQYDRAFEQLRKTLEIEPDFPPARWNLGRAYAQQGKYQEALAEIRKAVEASGRSPVYLATLGYVYAVAGRKREATAVLQELRSLSGKRYVLPNLLAVVYVGLGEKDQAFKWLGQAYQERSDFMIVLRVDPALDSLRSDPRFAELERRVGLI
jgi:TolB-like protein/DNA-binding winged helix-turn-helix (wHTH) protein/Tfp pilus assembly protein PilF